MIPQIKSHYLKLLSEFSSSHDLHKMEGRDHPEIWGFSDEEIAYMEQIQTVDDLLNYTDDGDGKMCALAYGCALAMGLSEWDAMSAAQDY